MPRPSLARLRRLVLPRLEGRADGETISPLPGLRFFHAAVPGARKRVEARMVTFATVLQGRKQVDFGDRRLAYGPGSFLFITGERRYGSTILEASAVAPYVSVSLQLPPEQIADALLALRDAGAGPDGDAEEQPAMVVALSRPVLEALERLVATLDDPVARAALAPLYQRELLVHLLRGPAGAILRRAAAADDGRIRAAMAFLREHANERIRVDDVARRVAMSPSHFAHRFREVARMGPIQYLKHVRLHDARLLMLSERLGAAEAAARVGYASTSHFTRDFKRTFGAPPAAYAERLRAEAARPLAHAR